MSQADLDSTIFAYDYRARVACVMTLRQIMSCKLDPRHLHDTLWISLVKIVLMWIVESLDVC